MAQERLTVRKIKEILRLKYEANLSNRAIAGACKVSNSTVGEYLQRARDDPERHRPMPNWEMVHLEKRRKGITLKLLWLEYKEAYPDRYQYSQFCEHNRRWKKSHIEPSMRVEHKGGERMQVDYAGAKDGMCIYLIGLVQEYQKD